MKNYNSAARKKADDILFLRKILPGPAQASYGIEVAKLAGVPGAVITRAKAILSELESQGWRPEPFAAPREESAQVSLADLGEQAVAQQLRELDVDTLTPIEAMNLIYQWKKDL